MNKQEWIDDYNIRNCTCKNASRNNSCKGLITCTLRANHPERKTMHIDDYKAFWQGRPQLKSIGYIGVVGNKFDQTAALAVARIDKVRAQTRLETK